MAASMTDGIMSSGQVCRVLAETDVGLKVRQLPKANITASFC
jgi:hypothetical protein